MPGNSPYAGEMKACRSTLPVIHSEIQKTLRSTHPVIYSAIQKTLRSTLPVIYSAIQKVTLLQQQNMHGSAQVACNLTIDQASSRDLKTRGAMKVFTTNTRPRNWWIRAHHKRASITRKCEEQGSIKKCQGKDKVLIQRIRQKVR